MSQAQPDHTGLQASELLTTSQARCAVPNRAEDRVVK